MKIDQIPDIYLEQYILNELPGKIRVEIDALILENPSLLKRIEEIKKSSEEIISLYPAEYMITEINKRTNIVKNTAPENNTANSDSAVIKFLKKSGLLFTRRLTLSLAAAAAAVVVIVFMIPGLDIPDNFKTGYDTDVRIKGLESKLVIYRMNGKEIEELKDSDIARKGDIIQLGYIAADRFRYGIIISIDGRGTVTLHYPDSTESPGGLTINKKVLLDRSYELDDSPSFERFIMILSAEPFNTGYILNKAKKLAKNRESSLNGFIDAGKDTAEFSTVIKKFD